MNNISRGWLLGCFFFLTLSALAQDFSNKGKDFWVGYGYHVRFVTNNGVNGPINAQEMVLYFATDAVTNVKVEIPALGYTQTYNNIPANTIFTTSPLPKSGAQDARLLTEGKSSKGIHITSDKPIVAYAHIYNGSVSGATLLFPTNTLGKDYYSINYDQRSNEGSSNAFFYVVAADTGNTTVEIIPSANTQTLTAGQAFTVTLKQGEVFNAMGALSGNDGVDLTGSRIRSISTAAGGCKRIAVFSGSGKMFIRCGDSQPNTADNYMVQAFPKDAWGKSYLTVPTQNFQNNFYRIAVSDPTTVVRLNGVQLSGLQNNFYYQVGPLNTPNLIEADKPIMVAQYISSQNACSNGNLGDPEVIYLSPVEQNIDKLVLNSTSNFAITQHFINVVIPNGGTGVSSFRIDGNAPASAFQVHPRNAAYSYLQLPVGAGQHSLQSDSGFNAIAYGYGQAESYGYNAGANVKDLYQFVSVRNQYATVNFPSACKSSPFFFSITFPYQPTQIKWGFNGLFADVTQTAPVPDSSWVVNGRTLYRYRINTPYTINAIGTYPIKIVAQNPTADGCNGEQEIAYDLQVFERPAADFSFTNNGCTTDSVKFTDLTNTNGRPAIRWSWDFDNGASSSLRNPGILYTAPGTYNIKYSVITDIGCVSDTVKKTVVVNLPPVARFGISSPACVDGQIRFTDVSANATTGTEKWHWDFGDGTAVVVAGSATPQTHVYTRAGTYKSTLQIKTDRGCVSNVEEVMVRISPNPVAGFIIPENCLADPFSQFTDTSKIEDGTEAGFSYLWNFGDANATVANPNTATVKNPRHKFTVVGPYNVSLTVTSNAGCSNSISQQIFVNGTLPQSVFTVNDGLEHCANNTVRITNNSGVDIGSLVKLEIFWDYTNDVTNKTIVNRPQTGAVISHTYPEFSTPFTQSRQVRVVAYSGENCFNTTVQNITLKATPQLRFDPVPPVCADVAAFTITQAVLLNALPGNGIFSGRGVNSTGFFNPAQAAAGVHNITYTYTGTNGCSNLVQRGVTVYALPVMSAGADRFVLEGGSVQLLGTASGVTPAYLWAPGSTLNNTAIAQPLASPVDDITYTLTVTTGEGCRASDDVLVKVLKTPVIPNVFSPNGDGINDRWEIRYLDTYPGATVEIFNRYGQAVFQSKGYGRPWDGTYNGNPLPAGTYYYLINPKNGRKQMAGFVDIIR